MSDNNSGDQIPTSRFATFFDKNGWWYAAAALMLLVILGLIAIIVLPSHNNSDGATPGTTPSDTPPPPLSSPAASSPASTSGTGWADLGCNGTKGSTELPALAPKVTWEPLSSLSVPTGTAYGPKKVSGFVRTCYQHTPTGALIASVNTLAVGWTVPSGERAATLEALMTPGKGRDATISSDTPQDQGSRFVAFSVDGCQPDRCNVALVYSVGTALGVANLSMVWSNGDWLLDGSQEPTGNSLTDIPAGYTNWKA